MRKYFYFIGIHWLFFLFIINIFVYTFDFPFKTIFLHMIVVTFLLFLCTLILAFASIVCPKKWTVVLGIGVFYSLFTFIFCLCLANFVSNFHWRENIYFQLVYNFVSNMPKIDIFANIYFYLLIILFALILKGYCKVDKIIYQGIDQLFLTKSKYQNFLGISKSFVHLVLAIFISVALLFLIAFHFDHAEQFTQSEPLLSFFLEPDKHSPTVSQALYEQGIRHQYPKNISFHKKNIILVIVDALRSDHTSLYGYTRSTTPFLQSLYNKGKLKKVEVALSNFVASTGGILATLSSRHFRDMNYANFKLHNLLKDQGYQVNFILSGLHNWYGLRKFYNLNDIDFFFDGTHRTKYYMNDDRILFEALEKVKPYHNNPSFFYFHLMSTHLFGVHREEFEVYNDSEDKLIDRYDNGIVQSDFYIKEIFATLKEKGYLQNAMVVILADHGEFLGEKELFGHGKFLYQPCLQIPILIYDTEDTTYQNLEFATQMDIAPTIVDRLGLPIPECWEGNSLLSQQKRNYSLHEMFAKRNIFSAMIHKDSKIYKYILSVKESKEEVYELSSDPNENNNILHHIDLSLIDELREKCQTLIGKN